MTAITVGKLKEILAGADDDTTVIIRVREDDYEKDWHTTLAEFHGVVRNGKRAVVLHTEVQHVV
jgi:hypothetical protein